MSRTYTFYLAALVGTVCVAFIINLVVVRPARTVQNDVVQGILIGFGLAFASAQAYALAMQIQLSPFRR